MRIMKSLAGCCWSLTTMSWAEFDAAGRRPAPDSAVCRVLPDGAPADVASSQIDTFVLRVLSTRKPYTRPRRQRPASAGDRRSPLVAAGAKSRTLTAMRWPAGASSCHGCPLVPQRVDLCAVTRAGSDDVTDTAHVRSSSTTANSHRPTRLTSTIGRCELAIKNSPVRLIKTSTLLDEFEFKTL